MSIETIIMDVCRTDLKESTDRNYTHLEINDIATDDLLGKIINKIWQVQEEELRKAVTEWEKLNGNLTDKKR